MAYLQYNDTSLPRCARRRFGTVRQAREIQRQQVLSSRPLFNRGHGVNPDKKMIRCRVYGYFRGRLYAGAPHGGVEEARPEKGVAIVLWALLADHRDGDVAQRTQDRAANTGCKISARRFGRGGGFSSCNVDSHWHGLAISVAAGIVLLVSSALRLSYFNVFGSAGAILTLPRASSGSSMGLVQSNNGRRKQSCKNERREPEAKGHEPAHEGTTCLQRGAISALKRRECGASPVELLADLPAGGYHRFSKGRHGSRERLKVQSL